MAARELALRDLHAFVFKLWAHLGLKDGVFLRYLADTLMEFVRDIEDGKAPRLIIEAPPRHSKSLFTTRALPPWFLANHPNLEVIVATATDDLATDFGKEMRDVMNGPEYHALSPKAVPRTGSSASDYATTEAGGKVKLVGAGCQINGIGGHLIIGDDLVKDLKVAESETQMEDLWKWFNSTLLRRAYPNAGVVIMHTRWAVNDLIGRIVATDKSHRWKRVSFPALAEENDVLGRKIGDALQPAWFSKEVLERERRGMIDSGAERSWLALFQQRPTNPSGDYFKAEYLSFTPVKDLPAQDELVWYIGCDFAVSTRKTADRTALVPFGIDKNWHVYLATDAHYARTTSLDSVKALIKLVKKYKPARVFGEKGPLDAAIMPILKKEMQEEKVYATIEAISRRTAKWDVAAPLQARMQARTVHFPDTDFYRLTVAPQFLNFSRSADGQEDDFVDALSNAFQALEKLQAPLLPEAEKKKSDWELDEEHWDEITKHSNPRSKTNMLRLNGDPVK